LNYECEGAMRLTIPAMRIAVAKSLKNDHGWSEGRIAKALGIVQPAVSKYMTGNYAPELDAIVKEALSRGLQRPIVEAILKNAGIERINGLIDKASSDKRLISLAVRK
jgi:predicted transcriptional regulator